MLFLCCEKEGVSLTVAYKVVLAVKEPQYLEALHHYVHVSDRGSSLRIIGFTRTESFLEYMNGEERPDLVVGDAELLEPWLGGGKEAACAWRRLGTKDVGKDEIAKYQPLPSLIDAMLQACHNGVIRTPGHAFEGTGAVTIGFVSGVGGSGKTIAAVNMAKQLGGMGLSVFYLNLELLNSSAVFARPNRKAEDAQGLPRLLYDMKAAADTKSTETLTVEPYVSAHPALKCDWFEPVENRNEIVQLRKPDVIKLLQLIAGSGRYDVVIIDTDSGLNERTEAVMEGCRHLIWIMLDDLVHMFKSGQQLSYLQRSGDDGYASWAAKSRYIVNRFTGVLANPLPDSVRGIDGVLPYIPSWKQNSHADLLLSSPIYQRDILKLCRELLGDNLEAGVKAYG